MWPADDSELEHAIDDVGRQMTAGEPEANLRARVMERLDGGGTARPRWFWLVPAALAAVFLGVLFLAPDYGTLISSPLTTAGDPTGSLSRTSSRAEPSPPRIEAREPALEVAEAPGVGQAPRAGAVDTRAVGAEPAPQRATDRRTSSQLAARAAGVPVPSEVEALAPPRLAMPSIQLDEIDPAQSIRLPRLETIEPITVVPIGEPQGERP